MVKTVSSGPYVRCCKPTKDKTGNHTLLVNTHEVSKCCIFSSSWLHNGYYPRWPTLRWANRSAVQQRFSEANHTKELQRGQSSSFPNFLPRLKLHAPHCWWVFFLCVCALIADIIMAKSDVIPKLHLNNKWHQLITKISGLHEIIAQLTNHKLSSIIELFCSPNQQPYNLRFQIPNKFGRKRLNMLFPKKKKQNTYSNRHRTNN